MAAVPKRNFAIGPFFIGTLLLFCALTFYYFAVLKIDYHKTMLLDLGWSDPSQYFAQARALLKHGYPYLDFGYDKLPSMYPVGYPALMLPWLNVLPEADSILAPFRTNQTIGLLLLLATFGFYAYLGIPLTGGFAALLLATLPGFFTFCRSSTSELSASALIVFAFMFAYLGLKEERRWKIYLSAIFLGLSLNIRVQSLFFAPLLLAMAVFPAQGTRLHWFLHCLALPIVFALAATPLLVLNSIQFHSPFQTGYDFWVSSTWLATHPFFSLRHIPNNIALLWRELTLRPQPVMVGHYFGTVCADHHLLSQMDGSAVLSAAPNIVSRSRRSTCHMGGRKSSCSKTNHRLASHLRFVRRGLSGVSLALSFYKTTQSRSIAGLGSSPFHYAPSPIPGVYRTKAFS